MNKKQAKKFFNVAVALRDAAKVKELVESFNMNMWAYNGETAIYSDLEENFKKPACGTPSCAFGHYAARGDLQKTLKIISNPRSRNAGGVSKNTNSKPISVFAWAEENFGLTVGESDIFSGDYEDEHGIRINTPIGMAKVVEDILRKHGYSPRKLALERTRAR